VGVEEAMAKPIVAAAVARLADLGQPVQAGQ
jgi:hypothetical protein